MESVIEWIPMGMIAVVAYFLKTLHSDIKNNVQEIGKLKGKIAVLESESNNKIDKLAETTHIQLTALAKSIDNLTTSVNILIKNNDS